MPSSSHRYVQDLIKLKETFIDPLLHPYATSPPPFSSPQPDDPLSFRAGSPVESFEHLPIASRFLTSPIPGQRPENPHIAGIAGVGAGGYSRSRTASEGTRKLQADARSIGSGEEDESDEKADRMGSMPYLGGLKGVFKDRERSGSSSTAGSGKGPPAGKSPYGTSSKSASKQKGSSSTAKSNATPFPSRSHQSLPAQSRNPASSSRQSLTDDNAREGAATSMSVRTNDRKFSTPSTTAVGSVNATPTSRMWGRKLQKQPPILEGDALDGLAVPPHMLPEDLRICLEVLENSLKGHMTLCEGLRKRYEEQYPLVRSLADVFVDNVSACIGFLATPVV